MSAGRVGPLYEPLDYFVLRAPLLPVERYEQLCRREPASARRPPTTGLLPGDPWERRAVAVGSPALYRALVRSTVGDDGSEALARKLLRYRIRMSTRPTPYGLFAGVALGGWAARTGLALAEGPPVTRTRPDMEWLNGVVAEAESDPEIRRAATVLAEPSAFEHSGRMRLGQRPSPTGGPAPDVSVRATGVVRRVLVLARHPRPYGDLVAEVLGSVPGATPEKVHELCEELWRHGFLRTDLHPPLTGGDPSRHVLDRLSPVPAARRHTARVEAALVRAANFDAAGAHGLPAGEAHLDGQGTFQVDSARPLAGQGLAASVAADAARAVDLLLRLHPSPGGPPELRAYRQAFEARYGHGRLVPVPELLDPRFGLGPVSQYAGAASDGGSDARSDVLAAMLAAAHRDRSIEVELCGQRLEELQTWTPTPAMVPPSLELSAFLAAGSPEAVDRGDYLLVVGPNLGGSSAGKGLGRFADLLGAPARAALERTARVEEARDLRGVRAELVYAPTRARAANVAVRPGVRSFEIPVGVTPGCPPDHVIRPDELAVCLVDGRLFLWWPARDVEVRVSSGHMLNHTLAPAICAFLDDVGKDGVTQLTDFSWGPFSGAPFLPRLRVGRVVLHPARWQLGAWCATELRPDPVGFEDRLRGWQERWGVPRHVYLADGDNRLLLDLDDLAHVDQLGDDLRRRQGRICLEEALPGPGDAWLPGPGGRYLSEIVVPLVRRTTPLPAPSEDRPGRRPAVSPAASRRRPPGSDWLFLKLYGPSSGQDAIVTGPLRAFADEATTAARADQWFFIRYADPEPHLRVRFHGRPAELRMLLADAALWAGDLVEAGSCDRFAVDVYEREVERYGGEAATRAAERLFFVDSVATAALLGASGGAGAGMPDRTAMAVLAVDDLLSALGLDEEMVARMCTGDKIAPVESAAEYRDRKDALQRLFAHHRSKDAPAPGHAELQRVLRVRRDAVARIAEELRSLEEAGDLTLSVESMAPSYVHMHCNRLLGADARSERLVLGLLRRLRTSLRYRDAARPPIEPTGARPAGERLDVG